MAEQQLSTQEQIHPTPKWVNARTFNDFKPWIGDCWWMFKPAKLVIQNGQPVAILQPGKPPMILIAGDADDVQPELLPTVDDMPAFDEPEPPRWDVGGLAYLACLVMVVVAYAAAILGGGHR